MNDNATVPSPRSLYLGFIPFAGTLGRVELEVAAAVLVRVCQQKGGWFPVAVEEVQPLIEADLAVNPKHPLWTNPFLRADFHGLVKGGFARWTAEPGGPIELLPVAIEAIAASRPSPARSEEPR